jgi:hypothetical protein
MSYRSGLSDLWQANATRKSNSLSALSKRKKTPLAATSPLKK